MPAVSWVIYHVSSCVKFSRYECWREYSGDCTAPNGGPLNTAGKTCYQCGENGHSKFCVPFVSCKTNSIQFPATALRRLRTVILVVWRLWWHRLPLSRRFGDGPPLLDRPRWTIDQGVVIDHRISFSVFGHWTYREWHSPLVTKGHFALRVDTGFALSVASRMSYVRCELPLLHILARHTKRFIRDSQIIHGFAFSAPGLPMVQHAHPQKRFARYSFPTLRTGNPVDNLWHLTRRWRGVIITCGPFANRACPPRQRWNQNQSHGEAVDGGMEVGMSKWTGDDLGIVGWTKDYSVGERPSIAAWHSNRCWVSRLFLNLIKHLHW